MPLVHAGQLTILALGGGTVDGSVTEVSVGKEDVVPPTLLVTTPTTQPQLVLSPSDNQVRRVTRSP